MHTSAIEDYLKTIYEIGREQGPVTNAALAARLGVAPASVTGMVKKLADLDLVTHEPYQGATLTPAGRQTALEVVRHHRLIERFLADTVGVPWDQVHEEAHKIEHVLSEALEARIDALLGYPQTCPHGSPIPTRNGNIAEACQVPLAELAVGQPAVVTEVTDEDPALLRYVGELGLYPGTTVEVLRVEPFEGPLTILVGGQSHTLGRGVANQVWVHETEKELP